MTADEKSPTYILTHLSALFENTQDAIWSVDLEQRFVTFNSFMRERILAWWNVRIVPGMHHGGASGEEADFWKDVYERTFQGEDVLAQREYYHDNHLSYVEFSVNPIFDANGVLIGAAGIGRDVTHLRKMDEEIRKQEEAYRQILNSTGDAIWSVDTKYRFITFNQFLHHIILAATGKKIEVGLNHLEVDPGEESEFWEAAYDRALAGEQFMIEREYSNSAGHAIVEFSLHPIQQDGRTIGVAGVGRDVTHLRTITRALETSEHAYRLLFQDSPLPMFTVDLETLHLIQFNRAALRLYGYSEEEFKALTLNNIRSPKDRKHFESIQLPEMRGRSDRHQRSHHVRKDGKPLEVEVFSHYFEIEGRPARLTLVKDSTKQHRAEINLLRANERFRLAAEAITSVLWDWNVQNGFVECFGQLDRVLGFNAVTIGLQPSRFWIERVHPEDRWRVIRSIVAALSSQHHFQVECRVRHNDGKYIYTWNNGAVVRNAEGNPIRVVGSTLDISERRQMELEIEHEREIAVLARKHAEEMNRLKSSFLANMSHEIRTPLTAILGFAELLAENLEDVEKHLQAEMIQSSGKRLLQTINQILDLARIEAGKVELHPAKHRVLSVIEESVAFLRPLSKKKGLRLEVSKDSYDIYAEFDKLYFSQILTNLIGNAIKFTDTGNVIVSVLNAENGNCLPFSENEYSVGEARMPCFAVEVRDEGVGISKDFLPCIFDEFKQESAGYGRNYEGTGIGLTITSKLVEMMHGSISVSSELSVGSRFIVRLPLQYTFRAGQLESSATLFSRTSQSPF